MEVWKRRLWVFSFVVSRFGDIGALGGASVSGDTGECEVAIVRL